MNRRLTMPASYVHQSVAQTTCDALSLFVEPTLRSAVLAGSEGPDPFFFSFFSMPGKPVAPKLGSILHTQRTDDFMLALCDACAGSALTRAYACGFIAHYGTDTTFHPFVYAHSLTAGGAYSGTLHCTLEHQLETLHYRRQGHTTGLPRQMGGFAALDASARRQIAAALSRAISAVFPQYAMRTERVKRAFDDAAGLCDLLHSESGRRYSAFSAITRPMRLDRALQAHMMPKEPPHTDIANDAHEPWASIWTPDQVRCDGFDDLYRKAVARCAELMRAADGYMQGHVAYATLRALHGGNSYDSGLPWQTTCAARNAPGVAKK